jgi:predicted DNA-binding transcriptional regulator AlpA
MNKELDRRLDQYLTEAQLAERLGMARITCQTRRLRGKDWPPHYKVGRRVLYNESSVAEWMERRRISGAP